MNRHPRKPGAVDWVQWWMLAKVAFAFGALLGLLASMLIVLVWLWEGLLYR